MYKMQDNNHPITAHPIYGLDIIFAVPLFLD